MINSALWDINRWGPHGIENYNGDVQDLMSLFKRLLRPRTQVINSVGIAFPLSHAVPKSPLPAGDLDDHSSNKCGHPIGVAYQADAIPASLHEVRE